MQRSAGQYDHLASGTSDSKDAAMTAAKRAIDNALDPKKRKHIPPA